MIDHPDGAVRKSHRWNDQAYRATRRVVENAELIRDPWIRDQAVALASEALQRLAAVTGLLERPDFWRKRNAGRDAGESEPK